jgi:hypothetical protein
MNLAGYSVSVARADVYPVVISTVEENGATDAAFRYALFPS